jgi:hypothetical protein
MKKAQAAIAIRRIVKRRMGSQASEGIGLVLSHPSLQDHTKFVSSGQTAHKNTIFLIFVPAPGIEENYILCNDSYSHLKGVASHLSSFSS